MQGQFNFILLSRLTFVFISSSSYTTHQSYAQWKTPHVIIHPTSRYLQRYILLFVLVLMRTTTLDDRVETRNGIRTAN